MTRKMKDDYYFTIPYPLNLIIHTFFMSDEAKFKKTDRVVDNSYIFLLVSHLTQSILQQKVCWNRIAPSYVPPVLLFLAYI